MQCDSGLRLAELSYSAASAVSPGSRRRFCGRVTAGRMTMRALHLANLFHAAAEMTAMPAKLDIASITKCASVGFQECSFGTPSAVPTECTSFWSTGTSASCRKSVVHSSSAAGMPGVPSSSDGTASCASDKPRVACSAPGSPVAASASAFASRVLATSSGAAAGAGTASAPGCSSGLLCSVPAVGSSVVTAVAAPVAAAAATSSDCLAMAAFAAACSALAAALAAS